MNSVLLATTVGTVTPSSSVEALGWTLLHFAWQGTAVALVLAAFLAFGRRLSPQVRYAAGCVALLVMMLGAGATFTWQEFGTPHELVIESASVRSTEGAQPSAVRGRPVERSDIADTPVVRAPSQDALRAQNPPIANALAQVPVALNSSTGRPDKMADQLRPWLNWIVGLWGAGVGLLSLRLAIGWRAIRRLRRSGSDHSDPLWAERFVRLRTRLQVSAPVQLLCSTLARVPMVVGWLRPAILLPAGMLTGLSAEQIEALLLHELAHVRRHDYLVNLAQNIVETLFFYHPAVWWVSGQIRKEREHCCDDLAAAACGTLGYAQALARLAELRQAAPSFGIAVNSSPLIERVRRLTGVDPSSQRTAGWLAIAALVALVTAIAVRPDTGSRAEGQPQVVSTPRTGVPVTKAMRKIAGRVMDRDGKPIRNARLWWVVLDDFFTQPAFTVEGTTDAEGRFEMQAPSDWKPRPPRRRPADELWILAPGKDLKVVHATDGLIEADKVSRLVVHLEAATETTYQVNDSQGRPVIGALVEPWHFHTLVHRFAFLPEAVREALRATTDNAGRVRLHSLPRREFFDIRVTASSFGVQTLRLDRDDATAAERTITLRPASRIEGRLIADDPAAVRGIKMYIETKVYPEKTMPRKGLGGSIEYAWFRETEGTSIVTTDQAGRFVVPAIADGLATIAVIENPARRVFLPRLPERLTLTAGQTLHLDVPMERSVLVRGDIRVQDTQRAVAGAQIRVSYGVGGQSDDAISDAQGRYEARVLPGKVGASVSGIPESLRAIYEQKEDRWIRTIPPSASTREVELPPILLVPFEIVKGTLIDARGRVVAAAGVTGIREGRRYRTMTTNAQGEFEFHVPKNLGPDSYEVSVPGHLAPPYSAKIDKHEPLVLSIDTPSPSDGSPKKRGGEHAVATPQFGNGDSDWDWVGFIVRGKEMTGELN
jgi:beta-lactamase regulating signal transducer with metallopeptidase domain